MSADQEASIVLRPVKAVSLPAGTASRPVTAASKKDRSYYY